MKKIVMTLCAGLFLMACNEKKQEAEAPKNTDLIGQNLKGKVKQTEETPYQVDSTGKIGAMDSCCIEVQEFDEKGYNSSTISRNSLGKITSETTITHYDGGQVKEFVNMADGKKKSSFSIQIDKDGKYSGAQSYDSTGKMDGYYTDLKENEYGAVLEGKQYKPDSTLKSSFISVYDKAIFISGTNTDSSGKEVNTAKIKLNDKRDVIERTNTDVGKDSTTTKVTVYKYDSYDEQDNWTQRTSYDDKGKATKIVKRTITYYIKE